MSTYAVSDLHGHLDLYNQIKVFLKPEDKVICLGDCGDRGPQSWETIKAVASDPQWTYLMGNHEHMLAGVMCEYLGDWRIKLFEEAYPHSYSMQALSIRNGGGLTLRGWIDDGADPKWIDFFLGLNDGAEYNNGQYNIVLTHAGFTPGCKADSFDLLWSREHFGHKWPKGHNNEIIVHGHTPVQYMGELAGIDWKPTDGAIKYCDGHKIDIDQGAYLSHQTLLLDLNTFDEHIFRTKKEDD